jgi:hypothetical protein
VTQPDYVTGSISPDGHVLVTAGATTYLVRGADLRAGVWDPVAGVPGYLRVARWDTGSSFFAYTDTVELRHCQALADCTTVDLPAGAEPLLGAT